MSTPKGLVTCLKPTVKAGWGLWIQLGKAVAIRIAQRGAPQAPGQTDFQFAVFLQSTGKLRLDLVSG